MDLIHKCNKFEKQIDNDAIYLQVHFLRKVYVCICRRKGPVFGALFFAFLMHLQPNIIKISKIEEGNYVPGGRKAFENSNLGRYNRQQVLTKCKYLAISDSRCQISWTCICAIVIPSPGDIRKEDSRLTKGEMFRMDFGAHSVSSIYLSITISYESFNLSGMKPDDMTST